MRRASLWLLLAVTACSPKYLPNTEVEDTPANRAIADVVERYRVAVEQRDVDALRGLVSRRYFSNAGTTAEPSDDYGYAQLEERVLPLLRENVKSVQFVIYLRRISFPSETTAQADFEYYYKFFYVEGGKDRWQARNDFARLEFVKEDGVWRIVAGL
ncbi:MAG TPA: nuclear transport factor 2 family protein [Myxococcota bacterium]|nr:nuclear transport factor 2 family protein [Myxococcota bacterium]HQK49724.1 nuclear transport factor 2 family protein [Myxococcota bacterium]